ncbi:MAG TPA: hypothetical protein VG966_01820 [Hyphomicrobiaceae bacterium]|nr:hypothetical protein [Hyphomicrobiaceae bacterium]
MRSKPVKARAALLGACAIVCGMATGAMAQGQPAGGLSDKSVATIMHYAWQILPTKFTAPSGKVIEVDKKNKPEQAQIPVETAREVIRVAYNSAQAQVCEMWEEQAANFDALMRREAAKKKWTDQQMLYITTLHRMTIHAVAGKIRVVEKEGELHVYLEPIEPGKEACPDEKRKKVAEAIAAYVKLDGGGQTATGSVPTKASPVSVPAKDQKKK